MHKAQFLRDMEQCLNSLARYVSGWAEGRIEENAGVLL
jgi:hypothetical protein